MLIAGQSLDFSEPIGIARSLLRRVGQVVILTLGEKGSVIVSDEMEKQIPSYVVNTVDTTGAGDTFCGAFVAQWVEGVDFTGLCTVCNSSCCFVCHKNWSASFDSLSKRSN